MHVHHTPLRLPLGRLAQERSPQERPTYRWSSIDPAQNRFRYYSATVEEDFWGDHCLILSWGRLNTQLRHKYIWPKSEAELNRLIDKAFHLRDKHQYRLIE